MNKRIQKRIQELAKNAGLEMCGCGCDMPTRQSAKFAELIVRECACLVLNGKYDGEKFNPTDEFHQGWNKALDAVEMGIKQYFGVEE